MLFFVPGIVLGRLRRSATMPVTTHRGQAPNPEQVRQLGDLELLAALVAPPAWETNEEKERRLRLRALPRETQLFFEAVFCDAGDEGLCLVSGGHRASRGNRTFGLAAYLQKNPAARASLIGLFEAVYGVSGDPDAIALEPSIIVTDADGEETAIWLIFEFERFVTASGTYRDERLTTKSEGYRSLKRACEHAGIDVEAYIAIPGLNGSFISYVSDSRFTSAEIFEAVVDRQRGRI